MGIMELEPGLYKIVLRSSGVSSRRKGSFQVGRAHLLKIKGHGQKRQYSLDNREFQSIHDFPKEDDYEIISKVGEFPTINNSRIHLTWHDHAGDQYCITVLNCWDLRNLFDEFPFLKKPFMYEPRSKK